MHSPITCKLCQRQVGEQSLKNHAQSHPMEIYKLLSGETVTANFIRSLLFTSHENGLAIRQRSAFERIITSKEII